MSRTFEWDEIPPKVQAFLKEKEAEGCQFSGVDAAIWRPEHFYIRSELLPITTSNLQHFTMGSFHESFLVNDNGWWDGGEPVFGSGAGWTSWKDAPSQPGKYMVVKSPAKRTLNRFLQGMRSISQPDCLVIGTKIRQILLALGESEDRFFELNVHARDTDEYVGQIFLFDPVFAPGMLDYENSVTRWSRRPSGVWFASVTNSADTVSYTSGISIRIARSRIGFGQYLISKDLAYTFHKHGIPGFDGRDLHKIYHNHTYEPKLLVDVDKG